MVQGLFIPADVNQPVEIRDYAGLDDYQAAVGGWIEAVDIPPLDATLYVNEEGLIRQLPFNPRATFLWWYQIPSVREHARLVGDVAMIGLPDEDGESTSLSPAAIQMLTEQKAYVVVSRYDEGPFWVKHPYPYRDYFEAAVWAMIMAGPVTGVTDTRVVPRSQIKQFMKDVASA